MPYTIPEVGQEPEGALLRRHQILKWLGVDRQMFDKIVRECLLPYKVLTEKGVKHFRKEDVVKVFLTGFKTTVQPKEVDAAAGAVRGFAEKRGTT